MEKAYAVRASHCDHRATEEEIYDVLKRTTDPLTRSWEKLEKAKKVVLKFNMIKKREAIAYFAGRRRELVDDAVARVAAVPEPPPMKTRRTSARVSRFY